jgi:hypothetical protein
VEILSFPGPAVAGGPRARALELQRQAWAWG